MFSPKMTDKPEALQGPLLDTGAQQMPGLMESEHAALVWLWKEAETHSQVRFLGAGQHNAYWNA